MSYFEVSLFLIYITDSPIWEQCPKECIKLNTLKESSHKLIVTWLATLAQESLIITEKFSECCWTFLYHAHL